MEGVDPVVVVMRHLGQDFRACVACEGGVHAFESVEQREEPVQRTGRAHPCDAPHVLHQRLQHGVTERRCHVTVTEVLRIPAEEISVHRSQLFLLQLCIALSMQVA